MTISGLPNLGEYSARVLRAAGIVTRAQLEELGPIQTYVAAIQAGAKPNMNLLWAIAGALTDTSWTQLPLKYKRQLRIELDEFISNGEAQF